MFGKLSIRDKLKTVFALSIKQNKAPVNIVKGEKIGKSKLYAYPGK